METNGARKPRLMSVAAAGAEMGVSRGAAYAYARRNELPGVVRLNGRLYVIRAALERFLDGRIEAAAAAGSATDHPAPAR
jgi:hypothetical protein